MAPASSKRDMVLVLNYYSSTLLLMFCGIILLSTEPSCLIPIPFLLSMAKPSTILLFPALNTFKLTLFWVNGELWFGRVNNPNTDENKIAVIRDYTLNYFKEGNKLQKSHVQFSWIPEFP